MLSYEKDFFSSPFYLQFSILQFHNSWTQIFQMKPEIGDIIAFKKSDESGFVHIDKFNEHLQSFICSYVNNGRIVLIKEEHVLGIYRLQL